MAIYGPDPQASLDTFEDKPMVMVLLGSNATIRVWLSDQIETPEQHAWALEQYTKARDVLMNLQGHARQ